MRDPRGFVVQTIAWTVNSFMEALGTALVGYVPVAIIYGLVIRRYRWRVLLLGLIVYVALFTGINFMEVTLRSNMMVLVSFGLPFITIEAADAMLAKRKKDTQNGAQRGA